MAKCGGCEAKLPEADGRPMTPVDAGGFADETIDMATADVGGSVPGPFWQFHADPDESYPTAFAQIGAVAVTTTNGTCDEACVVETACVFALELVVEVVTKSDTAFQSPPTPTLTLAGEVAQAGTISGSLVKTYTRDLFGVKLWNVSALFTFVYTYNPDCGPPGLEVTIDTGDEITLPGFAENDGSPSQARALVFEFECTACEATKLASAEQSTGKNANPNSIEGQTPE